MAAGQASNITEQGAGKAPVLGRGPRMWYKTADGWRCGYCLACLHDQACRFVPSPDFPRSCSGLWVVGCGLLLGHGEDGDGMRSSGIELGGCANCETVQEDLGPKQKGLHTTQEEMRFH